MVPVLVALSIEVTVLIGLAGWVVVRRQSDIRPKGFEPDVTPAWAEQLLGALAPAEPAPTPVTTESWLDDVMARRILVHTKDDRSIEGLLLQVYPEEIVLRSARLLSPDTIDLGGEIWLPRANILFVQMMPEATVTDVSTARRTTPLEMALP